MKISFTIGSVLYGWGAATSFFGLLGPIGPIRIPKDNLSARLICNAVGGRFLGIRELDIRGHKLTAAIFDPSWKRTPFNEPLTGRIFIPEFMVTAEGLTPFNELVLLHEIGHTHQSWALNLPRDLSKYISYVLLVLSATMFMFFTSMQRSDYHLLLVSVQLLLISFLLKLMTVPLSWVCEAHAEAFAVSVVGDEHYLAAVDGFRKKYGGSSGFYKWLFIHLERLPWDIQYRFIKTADLEASHNANNKREDQ